MRFITITRNITRLTGIAGLLFTCFAPGTGVANAQSTDITASTAIRSNEVLGRISARDIGDARLTDHFYALTGTPGDLLITVQSQNLNGDVDVFTAAGLRPLLKFSLYTGNTSPITKSIYLRKREDLILRIEARSPNDDAGTYRLHFGGSFEPITTGPLAENESPTVEEMTPASPSARPGRRVSSAGARIDEPARPEVVVVLPPEPTRSAAPSESPVVSTGTLAAEETNAATKPPARPVRGRRGTGRRTTTPTPAPIKTEETATSTKADIKPPAEPVAEVESRPAPRVSRTGRRGGTGRRAVDPSAEIEPELESGPRLIIETIDGTLINRYMSTIRRVTVENGQVIVVGKDGKIDRFALSKVLRMSISP